MALFDNKNYLNTTSYTLYLSSADKISGLNNNAFFNINWASFLDKKYDKYKVSYSFQSSGGYYLDSIQSGGSNFNGCKITADFSGRNQSYDSKTNGPSLTLGFSARDVQISGSSSNSFSTFFYQYPGKTISTPTQNLLNIKIYNTANQAGVANQLLVNTGATIGTVPFLLTDMTAWNMVFEFVPIIESSNDTMVLSRGSYMSPAVAYTK